MYFVKILTKAFKVITLIEGILFLTFILGVVSYAFAGKVIILDENSTEFKQLIEENPELKEETEGRQNEIEVISEAIEEKVNTLDDEVEE